jgi:hypothetical protein
MAAPIVGEKIMGARSAWLQAAIREKADLRVGCSPGCRFLLRGLAALILKLAAVEAHEPRMVLGYLLNRGMRQSQDADSDSAGLDRVRSEGLSYLVTENVDKREVRPRSFTIG